MIKAVAHLWSFRFHPFGYLIRPARAGVRGDPGFASFSNAALQEIIAVNAIALRIHFVGYVPARSARRFNAAKLWHPPATFTLPPEAHP